MHFRYVADHRLCCLVPKHTKCVTIGQQPPLFLCGRLMQNRILQMSMWIIGVSSITSNVIVLGIKMSVKSESNIQEVAVVLISNLSVSDLYMGVYMLLIACADLVYEDEYFIYSDQWRDSFVCKIANFSVVLSVETSLGIIILMTVDRYLCLVYPFNRSKHLQRKTAILAVGAIWLVTVPLSLFMSMIAGKKYDVYILSDVCIGLPLLRMKTSFDNDFTHDIIGGDIHTSERVVDYGIWYFPIIVFLCVNLVLILVMTILYTVIFMSIMKTRNVKPTNRMSDNIVLAIRMMSFVGTIGLCWLPIIIMGVLSQIGLVTLPVEMYHWVVAFLLPINSILNPLLYTLYGELKDRIVKCVKRRKERECTKFVKHIGTEGFKVKDKH